MTLGYLVRTYEELQRDLQAYDVAGDVRKLLLALELGCEAMNALVGDDILAQLESVEVRSEFEIESLLEAERHLLTQGGLAPRYVALLLNDLELAERAYRVSGDVQVRQDALKQLRTGFQQLADETCATWRANERALTPTNATHSPPVETEHPHGLLRRVVRRVALVVGGLVVVVADGIATAHGLPAEMGAVSVEIGTGLVVVGLT